MLYSSTISGNKKRKKQLALKNPNKQNKQTKKQNKQTKKRKQKTGINERVGVRQWKLNMEFIKNCIKIKAQLFKRQIVLTTE